MKARRFTQGRRDITEGNGHSSKLREEELQVHSAENDSGRTN